MFNFCSTDFCETKADVSTELCENVHFLFCRILRDKVAGLALALIFWVVPPFRLRISFNVLLLACFRPVKKSPLLSPVFVLWLCLLFLFYNFTDARPPCQTGGRSVYGTYYTYSTYQVFLRLWVIIKKARIIKGFRRFRACFFVVFWYTIIARSVHNYRTCGIQNSHGKYTKIARPVMAVCLRL